MGKAILLAVAGLVLSLAAPVMAQADDGAAKTDRCLARPHVLINGGDYKYDNLSEFLSNFTIVEKAEKDLAPYEKKFEIVNLRHPDVWIWEAECSLTPSEALITQKITNYLGLAGKEQTSKEYEVWLGSFWVNFHYSGPAVPESGYDSHGQIKPTPRVQVFVGVKTDNSSSPIVLSDDQLQILVDSVKTQRPVRLKGKMYIYPYASNASELRDKLEKQGIRFVIQEINGQPVY